MAIDQALIWGVLVDLNEVLLDKLGATGPQGYENCKKLLQDPRGIAERRAELEEKRKRLYSGREKLSYAFTT